MKKIIRLTESDLHRLVMESVKRVLSESIISGQYQVCANDEAMDVIVDEEAPMVKINDYIIDGEEAMIAINKIKEFLGYSNDGIESAIEQFIYDELR